MIDKLKNVCRLVATEAKETFEEFPTSLFLWMFAVITFLFLVIGDTSCEIKLTVHSTPTISTNK